MESEMGIRRREFLKAVGAAATVSTLARPAIAQGKGKVVICSWGGSFMDAQRQAFFAPFTKETGIEVVETTSPEFSKIRAMVESGNTEWDVVNTVPSDYLALLDLGMLEKIDYSRWDKKILDDVLPNVVFPYGIGNDFYSEGIAFSTKAFPKDHPQNWVDVWNVEKFPGPRMLYSAEWVIRPNEGAVMADGVAPSQVYPLDLDRSYKSLDRIRPNVVKWATTPAMPGQALVDGEAVIVQAPVNRIQQLKEKGAPVDFIWDQALTQYDLWAIPKGSPNYDNAVKFIEFASRADRGAELAKLQPLGPVSRSSFSLLPPERVAILPANPAVIDKLVFIDSAWWAKKDDSGKTNIEKNVAMWNRWLLK
jgi:putative spermidine/putrescine transport system substrate-binding protein